MNIATIHYDFLMPPPVPMKVDEINVGSGNSGYRIYGTLCALNENISTVQIRIQYYCSTIEETTAAVQRILAYAETSQKSISPYETTENFT